MEQSISINHEQLRAEMRCIDLHLFQESKKNWSLSECKKTRNIWHLQSNNIELFMDNF